jgi:indolepyruvate decarboxylase
MSSITKPLGEFLFEYLHSKGVKTAFGIPGDFALPTFRWLDKSPMKYVTMTHEPSVGFAADGYARVNGLGVALVTYCVGGLNMLNSIACAYAEKSPVVVISGGPSPLEKKTDHLVHHKVKTFDTQRRVFEEVTCANTVLDDLETAPKEIIRVVEEVLRQSRPGYIEVPHDLVSQMITVPHFKNQEIPESDKESLDACIREAVQFINAAKKPVIIADIELHRHGLTDLAVELAQKYNIPISATLLSKSLIKENHPLYIGVYSGALSEAPCQEYVDSSDCVIMLGTFLTDVFMGMYTSALERKKSIMVTTETAQVGLHYYKDIELRDFLEELNRAPLVKREAFDNPNPSTPPTPLADNERPEQLTAESIFRILSLNMLAGSTIVCDTGDSLLGAIGIRATERQHFISDAYYLSMGFAVPASIGIMAADPTERPYVIVGDGAFQMTGFELSTAIKNGMKPIVIVINNDGYGTQRYIIDGKFNEILQWNYTRILDVFGSGKAMKVSTKGEFEAALKSANSGDELCLIEAVIPRDDSSRSLRRLGEGLKRLRDKG